ncbi:MAG: RagB/SusD family nutrient uptake outer membrane protein [Gemmatimonadaceae bacterium]
MKMNGRATCVALVLGLAACDNMLVEKPTSFLTTDGFYKTTADIDLAVLAGYNILRSVFGGESFTWWGRLGNMSDQERSDPTEVTQGINTADRLLWTAAAPNGVEVGWQHLFRLIYVANIVLARVDAAQGPQATKSQLAAEAKFLRAYAYLMLDRAYSAGTAPTDLSVPLLVTATDQANQGVARATVAAVHAQIIKDLTEAEAVLPNRGTRGLAGRGRATQGAAQMALADLYLWRSSYMLANEWDKVAAWSKKVIDSGQYSLVQTGFFNVFNPGAKANNTEQIFFLVATGTPGRQTSGFVNAHYPRSMGFNTGGGYGTNQVTEWMLGSYTPGDVRGSLGPTMKPGSTQSDTMAYRNYACSTVPSIGCKAVWPMPYKFRPTSLNAGEGDVDIPLYRFAEALLMYAEAQNELGNAAEAVRSVNLVRARARAGSTGTEARPEPADLAVMGLSQMRDAIFMERNWELAHEVKRWWDVVRRDTEDPGYWYSQTIHSPRHTEKWPDLAQRTYLKRFPVPQREIDNNPALKQNPGY